MLCFSRRQADCSEHERHWNDAQRHPGVEEARLWGEQGLVRKEDPALHPGAEGEPAHLQAKGAAHSGVSPFLTCISVLNTTFQI